MKQNIKTKRERLKFTYEGGNKKVIKEFGRKMNRNLQGSNKETSERKLRKRVILS